MENGGERTGGERSGQDERSIPPTADGRSPSRTERTESERESECRGSSNRSLADCTRGRLAIAGTVVVLLALVVALRELDVRTVVGEVSSADPRLLAGAIVVYAVSWPLRGLRYRDALAAMGHRSDTTFATMAVFASQTANLAIPARAGDAVRAHVMRTNRDVPYTAGFASLSVERVFDLLTIAALAGLSTAWLVLTDAAGPLAVVASADRGRTAVLVAAVVSLASAGIGVAVVTSARADHGLGAWLHARVENWPRLEWGLDAMLRFVEDVQEVARRPRALVRIGAESLVVWSLDVCTAVLVLASLGNDLGFASLLSVGTLAVSVGNLAKVLPLSQGGVGLYEAAFTALVVGLTPIGPSTALAAAIVDHALKNGVTLIGGTGCIAALGLSLSDGPKESKPRRQTGSFLGWPKR
ncbi:lysylphosphatidylglycerol synthase transmembrane domain-containing protein [Natrinema halophilum]|uniref:Flippase-like domain-containing protein n=1 Tax=Natrinema halophilum TaxID=1699371 RepID=A0A7D5GT88_9EURY|nr:lysylphosphatidylglycerol synthase transmembrane domain-containing protein [Natrinema halophilum]QLG49126.1 flippase-like domain-containing protein [Natrinema halophilum]